MTGSAEPRASEPKPQRSIDAGWRERSASAQERALPSGRVVVSCPAPFGVGGLGRHLQEIVGALDRGKQPSVCICESGDPSSPGVVYHGDSGVPSPLNRRPRAGRLASTLAPAVRFSPAWRMWTVSVAFDRDAARLQPQADHLIAFNGTALAQLNAARRSRYQSLSLVSANSHMRHVIRQHARAHRQYPLERPWATHLLRRNLAEYARANRVYVASRYVRDSFIEEGFPEEMLSFFPLTPDVRYDRAQTTRSSETFDIVYVGGLTVHKGVPLLVDAVRRLPHADMRLVLVGGWKTRGMRRFIERACAGDPRISVAPGDPLPHLRDAHLYVHAAYEDGFAYAPAEALACGVPVLVSEDTGMKELIDPDRNGLILPTGDLGALTDAIEAAHNREIFHA